MSETMDTYRKTAAEMSADTREKVIVDLRKDREYSMGTAPGAVHIEGETFSAHMDELPKDKPIYLMCYTGVTSDEMTALLRERGYEAYSIEDGYRGYFRWTLENL